MNVLIAGVFAENLAIVLMAALLLIALLTGAVLARMLDEHRDRLAARWREWFAEPKTPEPQACPQGRLLAVVVRPAPPVRVPVEALASPVSASRRRFQRGDSAR